MKTIVNGRHNGPVCTFINSINAQVEHVIRNGDVDGYPGCVNLSFAYVEGESLLMALKVSTIILQLGAC